MHRNTVIAGILAVVASVLVLVCLAYGGAAPARPAPSGRFEWQVVTTSTARGNPHWFVVLVEPSTGRVFTVESGSRGRAQFLGAPQSGK